MGMVNQLGKFTPHLAHLTQPLRRLLSKGTTWVWRPDQSNAFVRVKEELSKPTVLTLYDPQAPMTQPMHRRTAWEQYSCKRQGSGGGQLPMHRIQLRRQRDAMPRLKRRHSRSPGLPKSLPTTSWENRSVSKPITSPWFPS